eukprot:GFYU01014370.1.p1 GENE.GFYU01014370.1~~GFYU01014370.1.p1  ORF type:complete len:128 (-),score=35.61 GFYU01014370.1:110-493(-)
MSDQSAIWNSNFVREPEGTPKGFELRTTYPENKEGVTVMLEKWDKGSEEPIHSHPGDDMTVVVEGSMTVQFYKKTDDGKLEPDGPELVLNKGDTGYISAGRWHSAKYTSDCKLVFAHDKEFGFIEPK